MLKYVIFAPPNVKNLKMRSAKFVHRRVENVLNLVSNWKSYIEKCLQKIFFLMFFLTPTLLLAHEGHFKKSITQNKEWDWWV